MMTGFVCVHCGSQIIKMFHLDFFWIILLSMKMEPFIMGRAEAEVGKES